MRADARRNYEHLLATAKQVFDERGVDAPLDEIARTAGVGNATLYRHFPTRSDLLIAVYADEVADLCARGEALAGADAPGEALFTWTRAFIDHVADKKDLATAIPENDRPARYHEWHTAMHSTAKALLDRARKCGQIRPDLTVPELLKLARGIALTATSSVEIDRLLMLVREGLMPDGNPQSFA